MLNVLSHPLVKHRVTLMRDQETPSKIFRELVSEITTFLAYEALRDLRTVQVPVMTPVSATIGDQINDRIVIVPILRAGMGMLDAMLDVLPKSIVGVLGMQRNEETAEPIPYYSKVPPCRGDALAIVIDPMLATGGSACDAVYQLKKLGYRRIKFLNMIAAPEGVAKFESEHPDVPVYTAALDQRLNDHFYIIPGLGDAGDRIFGTEENSTLSKLMKIMEKKVMADGRIDMAETGELLRLARPMVEMSGDFAEFKAALESVRADGVIDGDESQRIAAMLAALADKADAYSTVPCTKCAHPISLRTFKAGSSVCPWCGEVVKN